MVLKALDPERPIREADIAPRIFLHCVFPKKEGPLRWRSDAVALPTHSRAHLEGLASAAVDFTLTYAWAKVVMAITTAWILRRDYDNSPRSVPRVTERVVSACQHQN
jgi:hypothetical protein